MIICHALTVGEWRQRQTQPYYRAASLDDLGFLHCARIKDVVDVCNCYYRGTRDMLLLCIDTAQVEPEIRWEKSPYGVSFPHIHGPLNLNAVVEVVPFPVDPDGNFIFPEALTRYDLPE